MRNFIFCTFIFLAACASNKTREPAAVLVAPPGALELEQALHQGAAPTLAYLRSQTKVLPFEGLDAHDPAKALPDSLRAEKISNAIAKEKSQTGMFIRKFRTFSAHKRSTKGQDLLENFTCEKARSEEHTSELQSH